ncbi:MAG TPA: hypothetical protein VFV30_08740, partial [Novosphingobium sp.]|nr:hypothetical protein [Novosphingobium sp.]
MTAKRPAATVRARRKPGLAPAVEQSLADERAEAAIEAEEAALTEIAKSGSDGVEAIIAGASPDDAARMRDYL